MHIDIKTLVEEISPEQWETLVRAYIRRQAKWLDPKFKSITLNVSWSTSREFQLFQWITGETFSSVGTVKGEILDEVVLEANRRTGWQETKGQFRLLEGPAPEAMEPYHQPDEPEAPADL